MNREAELPALCCYCAAVPPVCRCYEPVDIVLPDMDPVMRAQGYRLHLFRAEDESSIILADEQVLPEKVEDPNANRVIKSTRIMMLRGEAEWLRDELTKMLANGGES